MSDNYSTDTVTEAIFGLILGPFFKQIKKLNINPGVFGYAEYDVAKIQIL